MSSTDKAYPLFLKTAVMINCRNSIEMRVALRVSSKDKVLLNDKLLGKINNYNITGK